MVRSFFSLYPAPYFTSPPFFCFSNALPTSTRARFKRLRIVLSVQRKRAAQTDNGTALTYHQYTLQNSSFSSFFSDPMIESTKNTSFDTRGIEPLPFIASLNDGEIFGNPSPESVRFDAKRPHKTRRASPVSICSDVSTADHPNSSSTVTSRRAFPFSGSATSA